MDFSRDVFQYQQFNKYQQYAFLNPENPKEFKTFFLQKDHVARKDRIVGETPNWLYGEVPPTIQIIHPVRLAKIRSGTSY